MAVGSAPWIVNHGACNTSGDAMHRVDMQEHAIGLYHSGKGWREEVVKPSRQMYCGLLLDLGLARGSIDALLENSIDKLFMPHGLGHFLGMDVHDVSPSGPVPEQLQPGHVVTCEPGTYSSISVCAPGACTCFCM